MSADNGIYILETPRNNSKGEAKEYRVIEAQAIDNLSFEIPDGLDVNPKALIIYFGNSFVYDNKIEALERAVRIEDEYFDHGVILEYGISFIRLSHPFKYYQDHCGQLNLTGELNEI